MVSLLEDLQDTNVVGMDKPVQIEQYIGTQSKRDGVLSDGRSGR